MINNVVKNKCYLIEKDDRTYAYISVKKDFYIEGICIEEKNIISGYFPFYTELKAFILSNDLEKYGQQLNAITIVPSKRSNSLNINGNIDSGVNYKLYDAKMDEYFYVSSKKEITSNIRIKLIKEEQTIKDINYLIRTGVKSMNDTCKYYYNILKQHRYGNLKELIHELKLYSEEKKIDLEYMISDLTGYLDILSPKKEISQVASKKVKCKKK